MPERRLSVRLLPALASTSVAVPPASLTDVFEAITHHDPAEQFQPKPRFLASLMKSQRTSAVSYNKKHHTTLNTNSGDHS